MLQPLPTARSVPQHAPSDDAGGKEGDVLTTKVT
jgi:hypothetical protein